MLPMYKHASAILRDAAQLGLMLSVHRNSIKIVPARLCPAEFKERIRKNKADLLLLLSAREAGVSKEQLPWLHVAGQVLNGEFDGADSYTCESILIGLRNIEHPVCEQAILRLKKFSAKL